eukprot:891391-Rhodomonas_salina.1
MQSERAVWKDLSALPANISAHPLSESFPISKLEIESSVDVLATTLQPQRRGAGSRGLCHALQHAVRPALDPNFATSPEKKYNPSKPVARQRAAAKRRDAKPATRQGASMKRRDTRRGGKLTVSAQLCTHRSSAQRHSVGGGSAFLQAQH